MREGQTAVRAMVIDHTPEIVHLVRAVLHSMNGIEDVDWTSRGDTAANLLDRNDYHVVILEAVVPYGEERLISYLSRSSPLICRRTILITTSPVAPAILNDIERANAFAVLDQPFDVFALADTVQRCIGAQFPLKQQAGCVA